MMIHANRLSALDRRAGRLVRSIASRDPRSRRAAQISADVMSPAFRLVVASLIALPGRRREGLEALAAAALASQLARAIRDRLGRPRPGLRAGGGFPSRHAAAAAAIARSVGRHHPRAGVVLGAAAGVGLLGRAVTGQHDPADLVAGALLGAGVGIAVAAVAQKASPSERVA
jgi:membrane-associated phospholipid phosphatase